MKTDKHSPCTQRQQRIIRELNDKLGLPHPFFDVLTVHAATNIINKLRELVSLRETGQGTGKHFTQIESHKE